MMRNPSNSGSTIDITSEITDNLSMHQNVRQEIVITTIDKLKLCLIEHRHLLKAGHEWLGPAGICLTAVIALVASEFTAQWGLEGPTWKAIFVLLAIGSFITTIVYVIRAIRSIAKGGMETLIDNITLRNSYSFDLEDIIRGMDLFKEEGSESAE